MTTIRAGLSAGIDFDATRSERRFTLLMTDVEAAAAMATAALDLADELAGSRTGA